MLGHIVSNIELVDNSFNCSFISFFGRFVMYLGKDFPSVCRSEEMKGGIANSIPAIDSAGSSLS